MRCRSEKWIFEGLFWSQGLRRRPGCLAEQGNVLVGTRAETRVASGCSKAHGAAVPGPGSQLWKQVTVFVHACKMSHVAQQPVNDKGLSGLLSVSRNPTAVQRILGFARAAGGHSLPALGRVGICESVNE